MFAANAGKKAGEFYTPHEVSLLMSEIVADHLKDRNEIKIYDPTSGSGSLLINIGKSVALARLSVKYNIPIVVPTQTWKRFIEHNIPRDIPKYFKKKKPVTIVASDYLRGQRHKILLMEERLDEKQIEQVNNMCQGTVVGYRNYD